MRPFLDNAEWILAGAASVCARGERPGDVSILIDAGGAIRIVSDSDSPLAALEAQYGARMAYRVHPAGGGVRVEGRSLGTQCWLESGAPAARRLLADRPRYLLA
ncbi:MAG: hypothetical protein ACRD96_19510 [Bryobacteraceae bacterium]